VKYAIATMLIAALVAPLAALAHDKPAAAEEGSPFTRHQQGIYGSVGKIFIESAKKMPEAALTYKPVDSVRTFAEILGHAAASQYFFCSIIRGESRPAPKLDAKTASREELIAAVETAFAYCDEAYADLTDASGAAPVKFMNDEMPKLTLLGVNNMHLMEHYGNLVTYMRMNGIVPPTSDPEFMKTLH
jgi:uncharacterized damage-inducible protein DinB